MYGKTASEHTWVDAYLDEVEDWRAKYLQLIYNDQVTRPTKHVVCKCVGCLCNDAHSLDAFCTIAPALAFARVSRDCEDADLTAASCVCMWSA